MRKLETNKLLQRVLTSGASLVPKKATEESKNDDEKRMSEIRLLKVNLIMKAEEKNKVSKEEFRFYAQKVSPRGTDYGVVILTKTYVFFYSLN